MINHNPLQRCASNATRHGAIPLHATQHNSTHAVPRNMYHNPYHAFGVDCAGTTHTPTAIRAHRITLAGTIHYAYNAWNRQLRGRARAHHWAHTAAAHRHTTRAHTPESPTATTPLTPKRALGSHVQSRPRRHHHNTTWQHSRTTIDIAINRTVRHRQ